ncbi:MAG: 4'-phosphopantetheinyl transferase superfamily protein [Desulfuromonadales bacterium]|nr:4'-phosphopantetheinyl transferase superfamily protein [Desulfuromonadales bacterium]
MTLALPPWTSPPPQLAVANGEVHLWRFPLAPPSDLRSDLTELLSEDEQLRAKRFLNQPKADQFKLARIRLRQILGRYLQQNPADIRFSYGQHGKPALTGSSLTFNLSHAGDRGVLAIFSEEEIGIDIELIDPQLNFEQIAARFFTPNEIKSLLQVPTSRRRRTFYRIWTRKEACLKAAGSGFSSPQRTENNRFKVRSFVVDRHLPGAVALSIQATAVRRWDFREESAQG